MNNKTGVNKATPYPAVSDAICVCPEMYRNPLSIPSVFRGIGVSMQHSKLQRSDVFIFPVWMYLFMSFPVPVLSHERGRLHMHFTLAGNGVSLKTVGVEIQKASRQYVLTIWSYFGHLCLKKPVNLLIGLVRKHNVNMTWGRSAVCWRRHPGKVVSC